jgi:Rieske [2Fe-2S] domain
VDNRCPHMGYPLTKGSVKDGILVCHWHHWQFDLKTGACFVAGGDDVATFPVEVRDGDVFVGLPANYDETFRQRLIDGGQRTLAQGLKDGSSFLIAKAVVALKANGLSPQEIVHQGLLYGATKTWEGWSSGLTILTIAANMWDEVDSADHNLFLVQGLGQIANKTSGRSSRRKQYPFPGDEVADRETLKRWFRRFIEQRDTDAAERVLMTLHDRGFGKEVIGDFLFTAATDSYFVGDGHALDFANKTLEALDFIEWKDALEILRPIVVDLVARVRHEETAQWAESVPLLEDVFSRLDEIWKQNQVRKTELNIAEYAQFLLTDDLKKIVQDLEQKLRQGVAPAQICRALTYAGAIRTARFHLKNEGDWHAIANLYSYGHALYRAFQIAPSQELLRGIFHGAVFCQLMRWLNMPPAGIPGINDVLKEELKEPEAMLARLQELADFQKVYEAELLVNRYLAEEHEVKALRRSLAHITVRENAELHMFQVLEAAFAHCDLTADAEERRIHLLAATRYITAQKVMKGILWSTENAERLYRGEFLSEREDNN